MRKVFAQQWTRQDKTRQDRVYYLDFLRIISIFCVLVIHVVSTNGLNSSVGSFHWKVLYFYWSISEFSVPVLFMISGALFLNPARDIQIQRLWKKNILRIVVAFIFWSALYAPVKVWKDFRCFEAESLLRCFFDGYAHLWFLYALIPLYIAVPFLRVIVRDKELLKYFLFLTFIYSILFPSIQSFPIFGITKRITVNLNMEIAMFSRCSFYFVLGYYMHIKTFLKRDKRLVYFLGFAGALFAVFETYLYDGKFGGYDVYMSIHCVFQSCGVFLFGKELQKNLWRPKIGELTIFLADLSFGVYLVHMFVNGFFFHVLGLTTFCCTPFLSVPILTIFVFMISCCISFLLHKLPFCKYVV